MVRQEIERKVISVLSEVLAIEERQVSMDGDLREDFDASSLDLVQLLWTLEEELDEEIPDDAADSFKTGRDIVDYIVNNNR